MRRLSPAEEAVLPAYMRSQRGVDPNEAKGVARDIAGKASAYPDNLFVQLALAEAQQDARNYDEAIAAADRALAVAPTSSAAHYRKGAILLDRAETEKADYAAARAQFAKARQLDPLDPRPAIGYYRSYQQAGEAIPEPALIALESVFDYSSYDDGYRLVLARQLLDENKGKLARSVLAPLAFSSHKQAEANKVAEVVDAIDAGQIQDARTTMAAIFAKQDADAGK